MKKYNILTIEEIETSVANAVYDDTHTFTTVQYKNLTTDEIAHFKLALIKTQEIFDKEGRKDEDFKILSGFRDTICMDLVWLACNAWKNDNIMIVEVFNFLD